MADGGGMIWTIYLLRDTDDLMIGYVGQTRKHPAHRLRSHMAQVKFTKGRRTSRAKARWFSALRDKGVLPRLTVLERCGTATEANGAEKRWIRWARKGLRLRLVNSTVGGQGVYPFDFGARISQGWKKPEAKARKAAASRMQMQRQWANPEFKEAMRAKLRAAWQRPERIEKNKAAWRDPAKRETRVAKQKQTTSTPAYRAKQRARSAAWARSPESRERAAVASRARWANPEYRARVTASLRAAGEARRKFPTRAAWKKAYRANRRAQGLPRG